MSKFRLLVMAMICLSVASLQAADVSITNADFETQTQSDGTWTGSITGWTVSDNTAGLFNPGVTHFSSESGSGSYGNTAFSNGGVISQTLSTNLAASTTYTLSVDVGNRLDSTFPGFAIQLIANGQVLATKSGTANSIPADSFETIELTYTTTGGAPTGYPIEIHLSSCGTQTNFDNVTLTTGDNPCADITGDFIKSNLTLNVSNTSGDFATINDALDCLAGKTIFEDATVTIQVADGTYTGYNTIYITHPQASRIQILGNTSDASQCKLSFASGEDGLVVQNSHELGYMDGFTLDGYDDTMVGILVSGRAYLSLGPEMIVEDFWDGVKVNKVSFLDANYLVSRNNGRFGFLADTGAQMRVMYSLSDNNASHGYQITYNATADISNSTVQYNSGYAANCYLNGTVRAKSMTYTSNTYNYINTATGGQSDE